MSKEARIIGHEGYFQANAAEDSQPDRVGELVTVIPTLPYEYVPLLTVHHDRAMHARLKLRHGVSIAVPVRVWTFMAWICT